MCSAFFFFLNFMVCYSFSFHFYSTVALKKHSCVLLFTECELLSHRELLVICHKNIFSHYYDIKTFLLWQYTNYLVITHNINWTFWRTQLIFGGGRLNTIAWHYWHYCSKWLLHALQSLFSMITKEWPSLPLIGLLYW